MIAILLIVEYTKIKRNIFEGVDKQQIKFENGNHKYIVAGKEKYLCWRRLI